MLHSRGVLGCCQVRNPEFFFLLCEFTKYRRLKALKNYVVEAQSWIETAEYVLPLSLQNVDQIPRRVFNNEIIPAARRPV